MAEEAESMEDENTEADLDERVEGNEREDAENHSERSLEERVESLDIPRDSKSSRNSKAKNVERKYDTVDGSVAIIYYVDEKTGKVYFSLERKTKMQKETEGSKNPKADLEGKYALWGGTVQVGEPHNEALVRELSEEDPKGYKIVLQALRNNGYKLTEIVERIDGLPSRTSIYVAQIKGADKWEEYKSAKASKEGDKAILTFDEAAAAVHSHLFAYPQQAIALEMLLRRGLHTGAQAAGSHTLQSHYSSMFQTSPYIYNYNAAGYPSKSANNHQIAGYIIPKYNNNLQLKKAA